MPQDLVRVVRADEALGDLVRRPRDREARWRRRAQPVQVAALVRVVDDLRHLDGVEQGGDGGGADPRVAGAAQQQGQMARTPVPGPQVLAGGLPLAHLGRQPAAEQGGVLLAEGGDLGRHVQPDHRPVAVEVEADRAEVAGAGEAGEPVRGDGEQPGGLSRPHGPHPLPEAVGEVRRRLEPVELGALDRSPLGHPLPTASPVPDRLVPVREGGGPDQPHPDGEPELLALQLQLRRGPGRRHRPCRLVHRHGVHRHGVVRLPRHSSRRTGRCRAPVNPTPRR